MKKRSIQILFAVYLAIILFLAIRPRVPHLYDTVMPSSDIGGFNMYPYFLQQKVQCYILDKEGDTTQINWQQHFFHGQFANSAHPNYKSFIGDRFIDFLGQHNPEVQAFKEGNKEGVIHLNIQLIKEKQDTAHYNYTRNVE